MKKRVFTQLEARNGLISGIDLLANTIKGTLGPKGRNVVIANEYIGPYITNDGATIAREFEVEDALQNVGVELLKEVALKTNDLAGDGTTTATLLAQKMIHEGLEYINNGYNPILIKEGIAKSIDFCVAYLERSRINIVDNHQIVEVATISSGVTDIGEIIGDAFKQIGNDALITIEESKSSKTSLEIVKGYQIDEGYCSAYMANDKSKMITEYKDPYFLITDQKIIELSQIVSILNQLIEIEGNLVLIADSISEEVLSTLVINNMQSILNVVAVKAPSSHESKKEILEDLAIITGTRVLGNAISGPLEKIMIKDLGRSASVKVTKNETIIMDGKANNEELSLKIEQMKYLMNQDIIDFERNRIQNRLAKLSQSAAVIKVGAVTELELKEKKMKIEDALCATKVAIKEGILPGSGKAFLNTAKALSKYMSDESEEDTIGRMIILKTLKEPVLQLLRNAGIKDIELIFNQIESSAPTCGYDIRKSCIVDLVETGIIDPFMVEKVALESAASIASLILTTDSVLVDISMDSIIKKGLNDQLIQDNTNGTF